MPVVRIEDQPGPESGDCRLRPRAVTDRDRAVAVLESGGHTCVLCRGETTLTSDAHGVVALLSWLGSGVDLAGFSAADRVVGRAAALLYAAAGVVCVHAVVASEPALEVLAVHGIEASADEVVGAILDRVRTGPCPMDAAVAGVDDPSEATQLLRAAVNRLSKG